MNLLYRNPRSVLILLLSSSLIFGCIEEEPIVDFLKGQKPDRSIVVDGIFTDQLAQHRITLTYSQSITEVNDSILPVTGAELTIFSGDETYVLEEVEPGVYQTEDSVKGVVGHVYTLRIEHEEDVYEGADEMIPVTSHDRLKFDESNNIDFQIHEFGYDEPSRNDFVVFIPDSLWTSESENTSKNRVRTFYAHPFFKPSGVFEFVGKASLGFGGDYYILQKKYSLSDAYYEHLRSLFAETDWRGSLLDTNPGNIPTNMRKVSDNGKTVNTNVGVVGFFGTCSVDELLYAYPNNGN